ncbi:hypothetical protein [Aquimarina hainanensis]
MGTIPVEDTMYAFTMLLTVLLFILIKVGNKNIVFVTNAIKRKNRYA